MTTATSLVPPLFRDPSIAKRLLTPDRLEQSEAVIARIHTQTDILKIISDIEDPSVMTVVLNTVYGVAGQVIEQAGGIVLSLSRQDMTVAFLIRTQSQAGRVHEALVALEKALETVHEKVIPGYPNIHWQLSAGVGIGELNLAVVHHQDTDRRLLLHDAMPIQQAETALQLAKGGQIVVHRAVLKRLGSPPPGEWIKAQFFLPQESFTRSAVAQAVEPRTASLVSSNIDVPSKQLKTLVDHNLLEQLEMYRKGMVASPFVVLHIRIFDAPLLHEQDLSTWQIISDRILSMAERYGGVLVRLDTNEAELMFHSGQVLEKLAQRAVSCALSLRRALQATDVDVRMSLASGKTFVGLIGSESYRQCLIVSEHVRHSKKLLYAADARDIVVTKDVQTATQQEFNWRPVNGNTNGDDYLLTGEVMLGSGLITRLQSRTTIPLMDRATDIEKIDALVEQARAGEAHLALITGAGGTGRSALIDILIETWLRTDGNGFLSVGPSHSPSAPYTLWIPIWQALFGLVPEATPQQNYESLDTALARLLPDIQNITALFADVLGLTAEVAPLVAGLSARVRQERLLAACVQLLLYLADLTPLLLVFEHVDFTDSQSLQLIERLQERLEDAPILICIEDRANPSHSLAERFSDAVKVESTLLQTEDAWALFRKIIPKTDWPYSHARALEQRLGTPENSVRVSAGYVVSLARSLKTSVILQDGGFDDDYPPQNWPRSRTDAIQVTLAGMSKDAHSVATRASAAGMLFYHHWPWLEASQIDLEIEELRNQQIVAPFIDLGHKQRWDHFRSDATRAAIYEYLEISERLRLHRQIAEWHQRLAPGRAGQAYVAFQLQQGGRFLPAIRSHLAASQHAAEWGADEEAAQHLLAAERLTVQRNEDSPERCRIFLSWAQIRLRKGDAARALQDTERAATLAEQLNDTELVAEAMVLRARAWLQLGQLTDAMQDAQTVTNLTVESRAITARALWLQALVLFEQGKRRQAARTLTRALKLNAVRDTSEQIEMELDAARILLADYQRDAAKTYTLRAQRRARDLADTILQHRVLKVLGHIYLLYGEAEQAIEMLERALSLPPPPDNGIAELGDILLDYAVALCYLGRYVDAENTFETALGYYMGEPDFEARERTLNVIRAAELYIDRDLLEEATQAVEALVPQRENMHEHIRTLLDLTRIDIHIRQHQLTSARQLLDELASGPFSGVKLWFTPLRLIREAELALAQKDYARADQYAVQALGTVSVQGDLRGLTQTYCLVAEAKILRYDRSVAVQDALQRAVRNGRKQGRRVYLARALYLLGKYLHEKSLRGSTRARSNSYLFEANMLFQEMNLPESARVSAYMRDFWQDKDDSGNNADTS